MSPLPPTSAPLLQPVHALLLLQHRHHGHAVHGLLKLRPEDFVRIPATPLVLHLSAVPCSIAPRACYATIRIGVPGEARASGTPLLDCAASELLVCETSLRMDFDQLSELVLPLLIGMPGSIDDLAAIMRQRYAALRNWKTTDLVQLSSFHRLSC